MTKEPFPPVLIIDPADQLQVGDNVTYMPEGVLAEVSGYLWASTALTGFIGLSRMNWTSVFRFRAS